MTSEYREVAELLEPMRQSHPHLCDAQELAFRQQRIVSQLRQQVIQVPEMRRSLKRKQFARASVLSMAAGIALWLGVQSDFVQNGLLGGEELQVASVDANAQDKACVLGELTGQVVRTSGEDVRIMHAGQQLAANDSLRTMETSTAAVTTPQGVALKIQGASRVQYLGQTVQSEQLRLLAGRVSASVPKLGERRSFSIVTPNAVVTVHGTKFSVAFEEGRSCVRVTEGLVAVHADGETAWLSEGASWGCVSETVSTAGVPEGEPKKRPHTKRTRKATPVPVAEGKDAPQPDEAPRSSLSEQNRLFQAALREQKHGRSREARRLFNLYLARYPEAALAGQAKEQLRQID